MIMNIVGWVLLGFGAIIIIGNYYRQVMNVYWRIKKIDKWSSICPVIGPLFCVIGYGMLPIPFNPKIFFAFLVDIDTVFMIASLPWLFKGLRE